MPSELTRLLGMLLAVFFSDEALDHNAKNDHEEHHGHYNFSSQRRQ
jgi:hypothetical protein